MIIAFPFPVPFVATLQACLLAVGRDPARPTCKIRLEVNSKKHLARFIATDGHWLFINELDINESVGDRVLHLAPETVEGWVKMICVAKKAETWTVEIDTEAKSIRQTGVHRSYEELDVFPPYEQIVPDFAHYEELGAPAIDAKLFVKVMKAFSGLVPDKKKSSPVKFWMRPDSKGYGANKDTTYPEPVIVTGGTGPFVFRAMAIVMPMRADVTHAGRLTGYYSGKEEEAA